MTIYYFDPSAWVKRYFREAGSEAVNALFRESPEVACCRLGLVEMFATVARKSSQTPMDVATVDNIIDNVRADFAAFRIVPIDELRSNEAGELAMRHRLRAMDALHLASASSLRALGEVVMVSADLELLAASTLNGLKAMNPGASAVR